MIAKMDYCFKSLFSSRMSTKIYYL